MNWEANSHAFTYPGVVEVIVTAEPAVPDDFGRDKAMEAVELGPRLINHNENQLAYYEHQRAEAEKDLARLSMVYSGQLQFDFRPASPPPCADCDGECHHGG